jgi:2-polyprenyl-3-methyl-5-hydroxy-6-metoxy-1,4-benzoquinol methylase
LNDALGNRIHEANKRFYEVESSNYESTPSKRENSPEQKRLFHMLGIIDRIISSNHKKALDFGAGTGNLTGKLLHLGYDVVAVEISSGNCKILKQRFTNYVLSSRLEIINSPIEEIVFSKHQFDLVCCYAVLHHLPDYSETIRKLTDSLKKDGFMYLDNELPPEGLYEMSVFTHVLKGAYWLSSHYINRLFLSAKTNQLSSTSDPYKELSDYWRTDNRHLSHDKIKQVFEDEYFSFFKRFDYHSGATWMPEVFFYFYKRLFKPDMSCWIAKK